MREQSLYTLPKQEWSNGASVNASTGKMGDCHDEWMRYGA